MLVMASPSSAEEVQSLLPTTTESASETRDVGAQLSSALKPGTVLALYGELGSGKTQFVKGIAEGLGLSAASVRSPTYTILHTYTDGRCPLHHFDAYRVQTTDEFVELGFEEYVQDSTGITCLEWADRVESLLPRDAIRIQLEHVGPDRRRLSLRAAPDASPE